MNINKIIKLIYLKKELVISFLLIFFFFFINTIHTNFPDEYDNIVGGYYITKGIIPYKGFFSHHGPVAYYLASFITLFTKQSFVNFRLIYFIFLFIYSIGTFIILRKLLKLKNFHEYIYYLLILGLSATYFWGHMLLADSLSGLLLVPAYILLLVKLQNNEKVNSKEIFFVSIISALSFFTSITYIYLVIILNLTIVYLYIKDNIKQIFSKKSVFPLLLLIFPYFLFFIYFIISGSLIEYYNQAILYNKNTYIYNYPRAEGSTSLNPLRYAIVISNNFFQNFRALLTQIKDFNLNFPFNITLAIANFFLIGYFLIRKKYIPVLFILSFLIFSNPRSNPLTSKETDFQSAVYIMISLFNLPYTLSLLTKYLQEKVTYLNKVILTIFTLILGFYCIFFVFYIFNNFFDKAYKKYMGLEPIIYNRPVIANLVNSLTTTDDYVWIGPHEFEELLYLHSKQPSKYHWFLRAHSETPLIKKEFMTDIQKNKPKIIVYKIDYSSFGQDPNSLNSLLTDFLKSEYFQLGSISTNSAEYRSKISNLHNFSIDEHFYFDNSKKEEILRELISNNIIEKL